MRFINFERVQAKVFENEKWLTDAVAALEAVKDLPTKERKEAIKKKSELWRGLKDVFSDASHGKCWYCESRENRSHNPIDHFRPKSAVDECPEHDGYWWLAFDWKNYRFCCTYCNSALKDEQNEDITHGKQDHFPILNSATRAMKPDDDCNCEFPMLLDPIKAADVQLLFFDMKGYVTEKYAEDKDRVKYSRAKLSKEIYNLNHGKIKKARMVLYNRIKRLVDEGYRLRHFLENNELTSEVALEFQRLIDDNDQELTNQLGEDAEYSSAARCYVMGLRRPDSEWLDDLLQVV